MKNKIKTKSVQQHDANSQFNKSNFYQFYSPDLKIDTILTPRNNINRNSQCQTDFSEETNEQWNIESNMFQKKTNQVKLSPLSCRSINFQKVKSFKLSGQENFNYNESDKKKKSENDLLYFMIQKNQEAKFRVNNGLFEKSDSKKLQQEQEKEKQKLINNCYFSNTHRCLKKRGSQETFYRSKRFSQNTEPKEYYDNTGNYFFNCNRKTINTNQLINQKREQKQDNKDINEEQKTLFNGLTGSLSCRSIYQNNLTSTGFSPVKNRYVPKLRQSTQLRNRNKSQQSLQSSQSQYSQSQSQSQQEGLPSQRQLSLKQTLRFRNYLKNNIEKLIS